MNKNSKIIIAAALIILSIISLTYVLGSGQKTTFMTNDTQLEPIIDKWGEVSSRAK